MNNLKIKRGLDLLIEGMPDKNLPPVLQTSKVSLDLSFVSKLKAHLLVKVGDSVTLGQPVVEDKNCPGLFFVSPTSGKVTEVRRGQKRSLEAIVFEPDGSSKQHEYPPLNLDDISRKELIVFFKKSGLMAHIHKRPFNQMADPNEVPRSIFIKAVESAPFMPSPERQIEGKEAEFEMGLKVLKHLTDGSLYLICHKNTGCEAFKNTKDVNTRTVEGPHPVSSPSIHIQWLDPIQKHTDVVWTLNVFDVMSIGSLAGMGKIITEKIISLAGPMIQPNSRGYLKVHCGSHIGQLVESKLQNQDGVRLISGDPLIGKKSGLDDFLGFHHYGISAFDDESSREALHFMKIGGKKFTATKGYFGGVFRKKKPFVFNTKLHGEERPFIDGNIYDRVMPLRIPTMQLAKAILAGDFEQAEKLGILEIAPEDFALPAFICPSKIELVEILSEGQQKYIEEMFV